MSKKESKLTILGIKSGKFSSKKPNISSIPRSEADHGTGPVKWKHVSCFYGLGMDLPEAVEIPAYRFLEQYQESKDTLEVLDRVQKYVNYGDLEAKGFAVRDEIIVESDEELTQEQIDEIFRSRYD